MEKVKKTTLLILKYLLISGGVFSSAGSPYFFTRKFPKIIKAISYEIKKDKRKSKEISNSFYYLKNKGYLNIENRNGQIYISLTKKGKEKAGKYQINDLKIKKPRKWDKKWRILIFDVKNKQKVKREALRGKIKELGLFQLQKSVWIYPYEFVKEIELLKNFFRFSDKELMIVEAEKIINDNEARIFFGLN